MGGSRLSHPTMGPCYNFRSQWMTVFKSELYHVNDIQKETSMTLKSKKDIGVSNHKKKVKLYD